MSLVLIPGRILETHYKTTIVMGSFFVTTGGWFAWNLFLDGVYAPNPSGTYAIANTFTHTWGRDATWWSTLFLVLGFLGLMEVGIKVVKRNLRVAGLLHWRPWKKTEAGENAAELEMEIWQELEQDPKMRERLRRMAHDEDFEDDEVLDVEVDDEIAMDVNKGAKTSISEHFGKLKRMIPMRT